MRSRCSPWGRPAFGQIPLPTHCGLCVSFGNVAQGLRTIDIASKLFFVRVDRNALPVCRPDALAETRSLLASKLQPPRVVMPA